MPITYAAASSQVTRRYAHLLGIGRKAQGKGRGSDPYGTRPARRPWADLVSRALPTAPFLYPHHGLIEPHQQLRVLP